MILLAVAILIASIFLIPLGLPGLWIMVGVLAVAAIYKVVGLGTLLLVLVIAGVAELIEFAIVSKLTTRYGGSRKAFWGALAGGVIGVIVGVPIPIIGSIIAGFIGSFVGAAAVTYLETKSASGAGRVGWGVVLGRVLAAAVKTAAGVTIVVIGTFALLG